MIMCVLLCYPVSIHMSQLQATGRPISSLFLTNTFQHSGVHHSGLPKVEFSACIHHGGIPKVEFNACAYHGGVPKV